MENSAVFDFAHEPIECAPLSRAERRDLQTQRILDAAKSCFVRYGFQGASMQQICAEAAMSPGALYRYFPSKEAIVEAICEADRKQDTECVISLIENPSVVEGLVAAAMAHIRYMHESGSAPLFAEIRSESMRNEVILAMSARCQEPVADLIRSQLENALFLGAIDPVVDLDTLLATFMAVAEGMSLNDLPSRGISLDGLEIALRAMTDALLRPKIPSPLASSRNRSLETA